MIRLKLQNKLLKVQQQPCCTRVIANDKNRLITMKVANATEDFGQHLRVKILKYLARVAAFLESAVNPSFSGSGVVQLFLPINNSSNSKRMNLSENKAG